MEDLGYDSTSKTLRYNNDKHTKYLNSGHEIKFICNTLIFDRLTFKKLS